MLFSWSDATARQRQEQQEQQQQQQQHDVNNNESARPECDGPIIMSRRVPNQAAQRPPSADVLHVFEIVPCPSSVVSSRLRYPPVFSTLSSLKRITPWKKEDLVRIKVPNDSASRVR